MGINKKIINKINNLKDKIRLEKKIYYIKMFKLINELYNIQKKINQKYTLRQLALDNDLGENYVYRIMCWRYATNHMKELVKTNKIEMAKICRIMSKCSKSCWEKVVNITIEEKMSCSDIDTYLKNNMIVVCKLKENKIYKNNWNISRDIISHSIKIRRALLAINNVPKEQKEKVYSELFSLKKMIDEVILIVSI